MKIKKVTDDEIIFNNGNTITFKHCADCCECNYADFSALTHRTVNYGYNFPTDLQFKAVEGEGFKFGCDGHWIYIPCYSEQNGYYSSDIDIYYCGNLVINGMECRMIDC